MTVTLLFDFIKQLQHFRSIFEQTMIIPSLNYQISFCAVRYQ